MSIQTNKLLKKHLTQINKYKKDEKLNFDFDIKSCIAFNNSTQVWKLSCGNVVKVGIDYNDDLIKIINYLRYNQNSSTVNIFSAGYGNKFYYYVMEEMFPLSLQERDLFDKLGYREFIAKRQPLTYDKRKFKKEVKFINNIYKNKFYQRDPHYGNIMKDKVGNYKFVDLESFDEFRR